MTPYSFLVLSGSAEVGTTALADGNTFRRYQYNRGYQTHNSVWRTRRISHFRTLNVDQIPARPEEKTVYDHPCPT